MRLVGNDTLVAPGTRVVLHRVGREEQGPVDSTLADARGRFAFGFLADTSAVYLLSARYAGIAYFATPVHTNPERPDTAIALVVSDTSSSAPVAIEARHIVVSAPGPDGTRGVVELILLRNDGELTRVAPDSVRPAWSLRLPRGAAGFAVGEGDFATDAVVRRNDSVLVTAPISPGEKQVVLQYAIPGDLGTVDIPFDEAVPLANIMLEEPAARVESGLAAQPDSQTIQGRGFRRWEGPVRAGGSVRLHLPAPIRLGRWALAALVGTVVTGLLLAARLALRPPALVLRQPSAESLLDALARLDGAHAGREAVTPPDAWSAYLAERGRLKAALSSALAERRRDT